MRIDNLRRPRENALDISLYLKYLLRNANCQAGTELPAIGQALVMQDIEAIVSQEPEGKRPELRLWLRLLSCNNIISARIRKRLREEFRVTLPRFDVLAQLQRCPRGLRLGELSQRMMVTGGNLTGIVDALVRDGLILRQQIPTDRRSVLVRLSKSGERAFAKMADAHDKWLKELFSGMTQEEIASMTRELDVLKKSARSASGNP